MLVKELVRNLGNVDIVTFYERKDKKNPNEWDRLQADGFGGCALYCDRYINHFHLWLSDDKQRKDPHACMVLNIFLEDKEYFDPYE